LEQSSITVGQSLVGIADGATEGLALGAGGVGTEDLDGAEDGSLSVGKILSDGPIDGWSEGMLLG
jgi:hypothetical protein